MYLVEESSTYSKSIYGESGWFTGIKLQIQTKYTPTLLATTFKQISSQDPYPFRMLRSVGKTMSRMSILKTFWTIVEAGDVNLSWSILLFCYSPFTFPVFKEQAQTSIIAHPSPNISN